MTLAELLVAERTKCGVGIDALASRLGVSTSDLQELEAGAEPAEAWGALVADLAIALGVPMSRFIAETGKASDYRTGNCGRLARHWRVTRGLALQQVAVSSGIAQEALNKLESGDSPAERWLPVLLGIAQEIDQPLFNFFYPYGVPLRELDAAV
ncbi:MAG: hypothetical protein ACRD26_14250 [Vicinamibacterales bacterium]